MYQRPPPGEIARRRSYFHYCTANILQVVRVVVVGEGVVLVVWQWWHKGISNGKDCIIVTKILSCLPPSPRSCLVTTSKLAVVSGYPLEEEVEEEADTGAVAPTASSIHNNLLHVEV